MIVLLLVVIVITFKYAFYKPTYLVILFVALSSKTLGFLDLGIFIIGGTDLGFFSVNMIVFMSIFFYKGWYKVDSYIAPIFFVIGILLLYGILGPVLREFETFKQSFTSAKSFLHYSIFFYVFVRKDEIDVQLVMKFLRFLGVYLAVFQILYMLSTSTTVIIPPYYKEDYNGIHNFVRIYFPTYMSLSLFLYYAEWLRKKVSNQKMMLVFVVLYLALILSGFAALALFTLCALGFIYFVWHNDIERDSYKLIKKVLFSLFFVVVLLAGSWQIRDMIDETINGVSSGDDVALKTREMYNRFRWKAIKSSPLIGMGFIHKSAPIMSKFRTSNNRFMEKFDVVDSGYVDLFVRFGYLGAGVYLFTVGLYLFSVFIQERPSPYALAAAGYLLQYYPMTYTWSVFTFPHGMIPLAMALFIIYSYRPVVTYYKT